jgi:hypothetical protein
MTFFKNPYWLLLPTIVFVHMIGGCSSKTSATQVETVSGDSLVAYLERTPCFGRCPYYSIRVYKSGYTVYEGYNDVPNVGKYFTWITSEEVKLIGEKANEIEFFELNDEYRNTRLTDFPTVYIEVRYRGRVKKITHYDADPPKSLVEMEDFIDNIFKGRQWQLHPIQNIKE